MHTSTPLPSLLLLLLLLPSSLSYKPPSPSPRRAFLSTLSTVTLSVPLTTLAAPTGPEFDPVNYVDKSKLNTFNGAGAGPVGISTMSSRARPVTNVKLLPDSLSSSRELSKSKKGPNQIAAELSLESAVVRVGFTSPWPLKRGMFYDVETRGQNSEGCYLQVERLPTLTGKALGLHIANAVTRPSSRFGANGGVGGLRVLSTKEVKVGDREFRDVEFTFDTLSPAMRELPR